MAASSGLAAAAAAASAAAAATPSIFETGDDNSHDNPKSKTGHTKLNTAARDAAGDGDGDGDDDDDDDAFASHIDLFLHRALSMPPGEAQANATVMNHKPQTANHRQQPTNHRPHPKTQNHAKQPNKH